MHQELTKGEKVKTVREIIHVGSKIAKSTSKIFRRRKHSVMIYFVFEDFSPICLNVNIFVCFSGSYDYLKKYSLLFNPSNLSYILFNFFT